LDCISRPTPKPVRWTPLSRPRSSDSLLLFTDAFWPCRPPRAVK
jgi:hypothetical protein